MLEIGLTERELAGLGQLLPGPLSAASPLGRGAPLGAGEVAALAARGWFDASGRLRPELFSALQAVATARATSQVSLAMGGRDFEHVVAFAADGSRSLSLSTVQQGLVLRDPAPVDTLLASLREHLGANVLRAVPFEVELDAGSGFVLAALIDVQRRATLHALADGLGAPPSVTDPRVVPQLLQMTPASSQWLVATLRAATEGSVPALDEASLSRSLFLLEKQALVASAPGGVALAGSALALAGRWLATDLCLAVRAARVGTAGEVQATSFRSLHFGIHDALLIDVAGGAVRLSTTASAAVLELVRLFVTDPDALRDAGAPVPRSRVAPGTTLL